MAKSQVEQPKSQKETYRRDIDGLRGLAVIAVLLYHCNISGVEGGFVGVDVFFVISGYLITSILLRDIAESKFSIAKFYERRIRRIFPALFTVLLATTAGCVWLFEAGDLVGYAKSVIATTGFASNILLYQHTGYFDAFTGRIPLLHTWSLAIEEQFYLLFPIGLYLLSRLKPSLRLFVLAAASVASLALSAYAVRTNPASAFYLLPSRAWELLVGALLSAGAVPEFKTSSLKLAGSAIGLALVVYSIFAFGHSTPFPGLNALPSVIGTALLIHCGTGEGNAVNRLLSAGPVVFVGLISYSLYMWHWPMICLYRYYTCRELNTIESIAIIAASVGVSYLSWRFVEQPFRGKKPVFPVRRKLFLVSAAAMAGIVLLSAALVKFKGLPSRYDQAAVASAINQNHWQWLQDSVYGNLDDPNCAAQPGLCGDRSQSPSILLWGDSHATAYVPGLDLALKRLKKSCQIIVRNSCPPLLGVENNTLPFDAETFNRRALQYIKGHPEIDTVILAGYWSNYSDIKLVRNIPKAGPGQEYALLDKGLNETVSQLAASGKQVLIFKDVPELKQNNLVMRYYIQSRFGADRLNRDEVAFTKAEYKTHNGPVDAIIDRLGKQQGIALYDPSRWLFDSGGKAVILIDQVPMFMDKHHLSTFGSEHLADGLADALRSRKGRISER